MKVKDLVIELSNIDKKFSDMYTKRQQIKIFLDKTFPRYASWQRAHRIWLDLAVGKKITQSPDMEL